MSTTPPGHEFDPIELPRVRMTREIPLWGLLMLIGGLGAQAIALYYTLQRQGEELLRQGATQASIATDIKSIVAELAKSNRDSMELTYQVRGIEQRVRALEEGKSRGIR